MYHIALVDDDPAAIEKLSAFLTQYQKEQGITLKISTYQNGTTFLTNFKSQFDIVFMDIDMPHGNGMDAAKALRKSDDSCLLVFVTNMARFAIQGYSVHAYSFILKPIDYYSFSTLMQQMLKVLKKRHADRKILIFSSGNVHKVRVDDILYVEVQGHKLTYHLSDRQLQAWGNLKRAEEELPAATFARCNACYLVNLRYVSSAEKNTVCVAGQELPISQARKKNFMQKLMDYLVREA